VTEHCETAKAKTESEYSLWLGRIQYDPARAEDLVKKNVTLSRLSYHFAQESSKPRRKHSSTSF